MPSQRLNAVKCVLGAVAAILLLVPAAPSATAQTAVQFDGTNDYITFGDAPALGASAFTLELWFRRDGTGVTVSTGTGGVTAIPLLTKGRGEAEGTNVDMNYFLGIRGTDNVLCADYEEMVPPQGTTAGLNHPVAGVTPIRNGTWYHAAAAFDGTTWRLYLNGSLEAELVVGANRLPRYDSIQDAGLATAMNSTGVPSGYFNGAIDEPRIWNRSRTQPAIADSMFLEVTAAPGLLGRWGLNEGSGTTATNSVSGNPNGTLTNGPAWVTGSPFALDNALQLGASSAYVTFGNVSALGLGQFTIETWFRRNGTGVSVSTGTGGVTAIPLVTKGRGEAEASNVDMNYFLGIRASDNVLCADFEEGATGSSPGLNHPIAGVTPIVNGTWYHAAATYDGTTWRLYLDGQPEGELAVGQPPRSDSIQHSGLATALNSTGVASGFLNGTLDETRIWSAARSLTDIRATINSRIAAPATGLVSRWGLDEGAGTVVRSTAGTTIDGTITGTGWSWASGAPFDLVFVPPASPSGLSATAVSHAEIALLWTDNSTDETNFEVERSTAGAGGPFALRATLAAGTTSWSDHDLDAEIEYWYRVRATNGSGASDYSNIASDTTLAEAATGLDFGPPTLDGYVTFGDPDALDTPEFTIETWLRRDGAGVTANTGTGGVYAVPLVTKGVGEAEASSVDMNFFLGIRGTDGVLAADFEEGAGGASPGLNHPILGVTPLVTGAWYHAAATYDGATWRLYLNGTLENELYVGQPPRSDSIQHAGLATALNSTGAASGYFDGVLDEARIWDHARTLEEIRATINAEIASPQTGLVARWALNEGAGSSVHGSAGTAVRGALAGTNWAWVPGAPFDIVINDPPSAPVLVSPTDGEIDVATSPQLCVSVSDPEADTLSVTFYGRTVIGQEPGPDFSLIGLPDTQYYTASLNGGSPAIFSAQTRWVVNQIAARKIAFVQHFGDFTENGDNSGDPIQWVNGDSVMAVLEDPLTTGLEDGLPFGISIGNHDQTPNGDAAGTTTFYNQYFGSARFAGRDYYGGHYGADNDSHFELFSASGLDFIVISMEYDTAPDAAVLAWTDSLLTAHASRRAIIGVHNLIGTGNPGSWSAQGQAVYDALKTHANLDLMLSGHAAGEGRRSDTYGGHTVHTVLADYQSRTNGGNGWLRVLEFSPVNNEIRVKTYSPVLDQWETDADSEFTLSYDMQVTEAWVPIATVPGVVSGSQVCVPWPGRSPLTQYEWYASVTDGENTTAGPIWDFTTVGQATLTVNVVGQGSVTKDPDLPAYDLGSSVDLAAEADPGWAFVEWSGDAAGSDNPLTVLMTGPKTVTANFRDAEPPSAQVLAPNGADTLFVGEVTTLQWTASDNVGVTAVDLLLSRSGIGGPFDPIATGIANTGSHDWPVTGPVSTTAFLRVVAHDAAANSGDDASDAAFEIREDLTAVGDAMPRVFGLALSSSNPLRGEGRFTIALPRPASIRLSLLDVQGREVALLASGQHEAGWHQIAWNGRAGRGQAPAGVYFLRFEAPGRTFTKTIVVAR